MRESQELSGECSSRMDGVFVMRRSLGSHDKPGRYSDEGVSGHDTSPLDAFMSRLWKTMRFQQTLDKKEMFFGCSQFPQCRRVVRVPPTTASPVFTVCALVLGGTTSRDSGDTNGRRISQLGGQLQHVGCSSRHTTRQRFLVGASPVSFVFWNQRAEGAQSNSSVVSRPTEEGHGRSTNQETAGYLDTKVSQSKVLQRACLWNHKAPVSCKKILGTSALDLVSSWKLTWDVHNRRCMTIQYSENILALLFKITMVLGNLLWKKDVSQRRCRVISKCPWWNSSCDDDVWLREQATMNRVQNRLVGEHLEQIHSQRSHDEFCCYFADSKTLRLRPASTHEMTRKNRICVLNVRGAPAREFEAIRQRLKSTTPYMVLMQHDDDSLNDEALKTLCTDRENHGGYIQFNTRGRRAEHNLSWESSLGFWTNFAWTRPIV